MTKPPAASPPSPAGPPPQPLSRARLLAGLRTPAIASCKHGAPARLGHPLRFPLRFNPRSRLPFESLCSKYCLS